MKLFIPSVDHMFSLDSTDPITQSIVIDFLRSGGIPIYNGTNGFDETYPYLIWDNKVGYISQSKETKTNHYPLDVFLKQFYNNFREEIKLNNKYNAIVLGAQQIVEVGCQTISFEAVEALYNSIQRSKRK